MADDTNKLMMLCLTTECFLTRQEMQLKHTLIKECGASKEKADQVEQFIDEKYPTLIDAALSMHTGEHKPIAILSKQLVEYLQVPKRRYKRALQATKYSLLSVHEATWTLVGHD